MTGAAAAALLLSAAAAAAPARARPKAPAAELVTLKTADGWTLKGDYFAGDPEELTLVLLHEERGRRQNWERLTRPLARRRIGYLALDLRGHGESTTGPEGSTATYKSFKALKGRSDWDLIKEDIAAAVAFLTGEKGIPAENVALGGAAVGGSAAIKYAALHPQIALLFLLSPGLRYQEVLTVNAVRAYRDRPILMVVANDDKSRKSATETAILFEFAKLSVGAENATLIRVPKGHGTRMLFYDKSLAGQLVGWLEEPSDIPDPGLDASTGPAGGLPSDTDLDGLQE